MWKRAVVFLCRSTVFITTITESVIISEKPAETETRLPPTGHGNMLIINANLYTGTRFAEAVLIRNGIVECAGDNTTILRAAGDDAGIIRLDAGGSLVLPGLTDAHMHLVETGTELLMGQLRNFRSIREMVEGMRERCAGLPFLISGGWDEENFTEHRLPDRHDLDMISSDRPVMLFRFCHHVVSVNSFVIEKCGLEHAKDIPGGIIRRDGSGSPTGILLDRAIEYVGELRKELLSTIAEDAVIKATDYALSRGLTTLMPLDSDSVELNTCRNLAARNELKCRLRLFLSEVDFSALRSEDITNGMDSMLRVCGVKLFADGSFGGRTALLSAPYEDDDTTGLRLTGEKEIVRLMHLAMERGMMVAAHAIGDRAIEEVLIAARKAGITGKKLRLEHAALTPPHVLQLIGSLRPAVVVQPHFLVGDWWLPARLGERCSDCYLFHTFVEMGLNPVGSSDSPVEPLDPWTGMLCAVDRGKHAGVKIAEMTAGEAVDAETAVRMYTAWSGAASGEQGIIGMLEPGSYGDVVIMDEKSIEAAIRRPAVLLTAVAGHIVYRSAGCIMNVC